MDNTDLLKDLVLSTLSEIEEEESISFEEKPVQKPKQSQKRIEPELPKVEEIQVEEPSPKFEPHQPREEEREKIRQEEKKRKTKVTLEELNEDEEVSASFEIPEIQENFVSSNNEVEFLENILKKSSTLLQGLQSPEVKSREMKCDLTMKYLQYLNVEILNRLEKLN
jgi:hypothetical protein